MVTRIIEAKPEDLRGFIEEAAGISRYKERRRETENRIRHTRENLARVEDIRKEIGTQLARLEKQSKARGQIQGAEAGRAAGTRATRRAALPRARCASCRNRNASLPRTRTRWTRRSRSSARPKPEIEQQRAAQHRGQRALQRRSFRVLHGGRRDLAPGAGDRARARDARQPVTRAGAGQPRLGRGQCASTSRRPAACRIIRRSRPAKPAG